MKTPAWSAARPLHLIPPWKNIMLFTLQYGHSCALSATRHIKAKKTWSNIYLITLTLKSCPSLAAIVRRDLVLCLRFICVITAERDLLPARTVTRGSWRMQSWTGERPYACTLCDKTFTQLYPRTVHLRMHKKEKPYLCSTCGMSFCSSGALLVHSRTHTGEQPHQCDSCEKRFATAVQLTVHRRFHTGERPYPCSQCDKSFHCSSGLKKHMRTHTGEKPVFNVSQDIFSKIQHEDTPQSPQEHLAYCGGSFWREVDSGIMCT